MKICKGWYKMQRVYDDRTNETLFTGDTFDCTQFMINNYDEDSEDFKHIWMEKVSE